MPEKFSIDKNGIGFKDSILDLFLIEFQLNGRLVAVKMLWAENIPQALVLAECIMYNDIRQGGGVKYHTICCSGVMKRI